MSTILTKILSTRLLIDYGSLWGILYQNVLEKLRSVEIYVFQNYIVECMSISDLSWLIIGFKSLIVLGPTLSRIPTTLFGQSTQ